MVEVKIRLSAFVTKTFYFDNGDKGDQVLVNPPVYNKKVTAEGYDKLLVGKLELEDQDLIFYQEYEDSPIYLKELIVCVKGFKLGFLDLQFKSHEDSKMKHGLLTALKQKHKLTNS